MDSFVFLFLRASMNMRVLRTEQTLEGSISQTPPCQNENALAVSEWHAGIQVLNSDRSARNLRSPYGDVVMRPWLCLSMACKGIGKGAPRGLSAINIHHREPRLTRTDVQIYTYIYIMHTALLRTASWRPAPTP